MRCMVNVPKQIKFYNTTEDFDNYQRINDKFWLDIYEFVSKYGVKEDISYRHRISKIFVDHITEKLHHVTKINGEFVPTCHEERHVDTWMRYNYTLLGFSYVAFYSSSYPDCNCVFDLKLSKIFPKLYNDEKHLIYNFLVGRRNGYNMAIELEYLSSNFKYHKHNPDNVDMIICYKKDREIFDSYNVPVPILELKSFGVIPDRTEEDYRLENIEFFIDSTRQGIIYDISFPDINKNSLVEYRDNLIDYIESNLKIGTEREKSFITNNPEILDIFSILEDYGIVTN